MDLFSMNFEHFCAQTEFFPVFSRVAGKNAVSLGCAGIRGNGGLCAPIGLHARKRGSRAMSCCAVALDSRFRVASAGMTMNYLGDKRGATRDAGDDAALPDLAAGARP